MAGTSPVCADGTAGGAGATPGADCAGGEPENVTLLPDASAGFLPLPPSSFLMMDDMQQKIFKGAP